MTDYFEFIYIWPPTPLRARAAKCLSAVLFFSCLAPVSFAQSEVSDSSLLSSPQVLTAEQAQYAEFAEAQLTPANSPAGAQSSPPTTANAPAAAAPPQSADDLPGQQTKRIVGIVPNFQAVSADTYLPPMSLKQKFWLATQGNFDYSSFVFVGIQAGVEQATNTIPEFQSGGAAFGRYYWHIFADQTIGGYVAGAILPAITHEDPRYYTLYHGSFFRRVGYAMSRSVIARTDSGGETFNISEIFGNGIATGISNFYYPAQERAGAGEVCERWVVQLLNDAVSNIFTEFWPDIHQKFFHKHS